MSMVFNLNLPQHLSTVNRVRKVTTLANRWSLRRVVQEFNVDKNTTLRIKRRWVNEEGVRNLKSGRKRVLLKVTIERLLLTSFEVILLFYHYNSKKRNITLHFLHRKFFCVLKICNLINYSVARIWFLTPSHQHRRLKFAEEYIKMDHHFWESVIYTGEKNFQLPICGHVCQRVQGSGIF